jgi:hypothetical protein
VDRSDELLADVPDTDHHLGRLAGYRRGSRVRAAIFAAVGLSVVAAAIGGRWYARRIEDRARGSAPSYWLAPGEPAEARPRELRWTTGRARLGLSRAPPGVHAIRLPDRIVRLARGCDRAQIRVDVRDGSTLALDVIAGAIEQEPVPAP